MGHVLVYSTHQYTAAIVNRLKKATVNVTAAQSKEEFDELIKNSKFDLCVLDSSDEAQIFELVKEIRNSEENQHSSILYLKPGAITFKEIREGYEKAPIMGMSKPFAPKEFVNLAKLLIKMKKQHDELVISKSQIEQFAIMASHDLRNPLKNILSFSSLLKDELCERGVDDEVADYGRTIFNETHKMINFVEELFDYSRAGNVEVKRTEFNLQATVLEQFDAIKKNYPVREIDLNLVGLPEVFCGDVIKMNHIFQNLIENAIKYSNPEEVTSIEVTFSQPFEHEYLVSVKDNGYGIDEKYLPKIFQPFRRGGLNIEGTGIGLAMVEKMIEALGGKIWVETTVGEGSKFSFTLGRAKSDSEDFKKSA